LLDEDKSPERSLSGKDGASIIEATKTNNAAQDLIRKTGDLTVYKYYFKSVGLLPMVIFVFFVLLEVFSGNFSSNYFPNQFRQ